MNQIELFYNPYRTLSRIVVGNTPVAEHDELAKYQKESFHIWCEQIFELITNEINDSYELTFHSTFVECEILKTLAQQMPDCKGIKTCGCAVNLPLQNRFDALLQVQKSTAKYTIHLILPPSSQQLLSHITAGMATSGGGYQMQTDYSHCTVRLLPASSNQRLDDPLTLNVWLSPNSRDWTHIPVGRPGGQPLLFICLDNQAPTGFREKRGDIYCYSCESAKLQKLLLRFLEFACITPDFQRRFLAVRSAPGYTSNGNLALEVLDSVDPIVRVSAPAALEVGQREPLRIEVFPAGAPCPALTFQTTPNGIVVCDSSSIQALASGSAEVRAYPQGGVEPYSIFCVDTIARNRITQMDFQDAALILPVGVVCSLKLNFLPGDADNTDAILWKTTDANVAKVKQGGRIKAVGPGQCTIIAEAEGVATSCTVTVQPTIQKIALSDEKLCVHIGESAQLKYSFFPKTAYDTQVTVRIDDPTIVSYQNGRILPRCIGKTSIVFESAYGGAKAVCHVEVDSSFHAKQRGVSFVSIAVILCILSFFMPGILRIGLAVGGVVCLLLGFLRGKKTITLLMILTLIACLLSAGYAVTPFLM